MTDATPQKPFPPSASPAATGPRLAGERAVVTGGAAGIGRAIAVRFAREGAAVAIFDVDAGGAEAVARSITADGGGAIAIAADVTDEAAVSTATERAAAALGGLSILVNNAGISGFVPLLADDAPATWHRVLAVNLFGAYWCARAAVPHLRRDGGAIVNIASTRALASEPNGEPYGAAKGGLLALTHALAVSLGPMGIRVNAISPGWIHTGGDAPTAEDHAQHPAGRVGAPEDVASAAVFLAARGESGFLTGQNVVLDGGMTVKMIYA